MAEIVSSAIVEETVSQIFSRITTTSSKDKDKPDEEAAGVGLERLEMARIKMEAALEVSNKWQIIDVPLLRWRKKLKRAAQDCENEARRCRQLSQEEDERERMVRQSSFPRRVAHTTKAFISSFISRNNDHCSENIAAVRRFERFADGATEFIRFVQLGGTPRQHLFFNPLIRHIFSGKSLGYMILHPGGQYHFFGIRPMGFEERGMEAMLTFIYEDCKMPKNSFRLGLMMRLSESTDIIGTTIKCLRMVTPHFRSTADLVMKEISQLPTQDFDCAPPEVVNLHMEDWNHVHNTLTGWFRPDPLCCKGYEHDHDVPSCRDASASNSNIGSEHKLRLASIFPEPVSQVFLQRHISLLEYSNLQGSTTRYDTSSLENYPPLKLGIMFLPHDSSEEPKSISQGSAIEVIDGDKQNFTHVNVHLDQLDEMVLPKAIDYLYHKDEATTYQICCRSNHGSAHLYVGKTSTTRMSGASRASTRQGRKNKSRKLVRGMQWEQLKKMQREQLISQILPETLGRAFLREITEHVYGMAQTVSI